MEAAIEAAIKNNAKNTKNNMENKEKLVSHLDELVDSMATKPGCGPVFSGLDVLPDMIKEYDMLDEMIKNDPVLTEEMRKEEEKEIVVENITLEEILDDISNGALVNFGDSNLEEMIRDKKRCMINEKLAKQIEQHKKRWKEHPEKCQAEINSMSEEDVYDGIRSCTFLDTEIPGEAREKFVKRLKKKSKRNK